MLQRIHYHSELLHEGYWHTSGHPDIHCQCYCTISRHGPGDGWATRAKPTLKRKGDMGTRNCGMYHGPTYIITLQPSPFQGSRSACVLSALNFASSVSAVLSGLVAWTPLSCDCLGLAMEEHQVLPWKSVSF